MCWAAFSSASIQKSVAEDFVKEGNGSLFILHSVKAQPISRFSMFPEEEEVLFRPNTVFRIDSTLYQSSDIGQFYCSVDNLVMTEIPGLSCATDVPLDTARELLLPTSLAASATNGMTDIMISVPPELFYPLLSDLQHLPSTQLQQLDVQTDHQDHVVRAVVAMAGRMRQPEFATLSPEFATYLPRVGICSPRRLSVNSADWELWGSVDHCELSDQQTPGAMLKGWDPVECASCHSSGELP